jgi:hypothetical protein
VGGVDWFGGLVPATGSVLLLPPVSLPLTEGIAALEASLLLIGALSCCFASTEGFCAQAIPLLAKRKVPTDKTSTTSKARFFQLNEWSVLIDLCWWAKYKEINASYPSNTNGPPFFLSRQQIPATDLRRRVRTMRTSKCAI